MKKSILAFSLLAFGSLQLSAAPCSAVAVPTLANFNLLGAGGCTITNTNGGGTWTLNMFGFSNGNPTFNSAYSSPPAATMNSFNVLFNYAPSAPGFSNGFSVQIVANTQNYAGFSATAVNGLGSQQTTMETTFQIASGNSGVSQITRIGGSLDGPPSLSLPNSTNNQPGPAATLQKYVQQASNLSNTGVFQPDTNSLPGSAFVVAIPPVAFNTSLYAPGVGALVLVDKLRLDGGSTAGNSVTIGGYTNYFAPTNVVPEPMTFALMGAGLIGLGVLRRRK